MKQILAVLAVLFCAVTLSANDDSRTTSHDDSTMDTGPVDAIVKHPFWKRPIKPITREYVEELADILTGKSPGPKWHTTGRQLDIFENGMIGRKANDYRMQTPGRFISVNGQTQDRAAALRLLRDALDEAMTKQTPLWP